MTTKLTKEVSRVTPAWVRDRSKMRELVVTLTVGGIEVRPKGTRVRYTIPYEQLYVVGANNAAEEQRTAKRRKRAEQQLLKRANR